MEILMVSGFQHSLGTFLMPCWSKWASQVCYSGLWIQGEKLCFYEKSIVVVKMELQLSGVEYDAIYCHLLIPDFSGLLTVTYFNFFVVVVFWYTAAMCFLKLSYCSQRSSLTSGTILKFLSIFRHFAAG